MPQLDVAAALTDFREACSRESSYDLRPGQPRTAPEGAGSRCDFDRGDDRRLALLRQRGIFEVKLQGFTEVGERIVDRLTLAGDFHLEAPGHVPRLRMSDRGG